MKSLTQEEFDALKAALEVNNVEADRQMRKDTGELDDETLRLLGEIFGGK